MVFAYDFEVLFSALHLIKLIADFEIFLAVDLYICDHLST